MLGTEQEEQRLRGLFTGSDEAAQQRIDEVKRLAGDEEADQYRLGYRHARTRGDLHPVVKALGAAAFFRDAAGTSGIVRSPPPVR